MKFWRAPIVTRLSVLLSWTLAVLTLHTATACCCPAPQQPAAHVSVDPGWVLLGELQARYRQAHTIGVDATITCAGRMGCDLHEQLWLGDAGRARVQLAGTRDGVAVASAFVTDGTHAVVNAGASAPDDHAREALLHGLLSTGLLQNAQRLMAGQAPEHADAHTERERLTPQGLNIALDVVSAHDVTFIAIISLDASGDAVKRVQHAVGCDDDVVVERYRIAINAPIDDSTFSVP